MQMKKGDSDFATQILLLLPKSCNGQVFSKVPEQPAACSDQTAKPPARCPALLSKGKAWRRMKVKD